MTFWTNWTRRRGERPDDFADVREELSALPVPAADERLLARVLASRRRGLRVILPLEDAARGSRPWTWVAAVAAAVAVVSAVTLATRDRGAVSGSEGWFTGDRAYAQPRAGLPAYPEARITHAERMRPMRLEYRATVRSARELTTRTIVLSAARDQVDGMPAWRVISTSHGPGSATQQDSVWVSAATLAPLRRTIVEAPYSRYERIEVRQAFRGPRVQGEMKAFQDGRVAARRTFDRALPAGVTPCVADAFAALFHSGVDMNRSWTGRVALLGWAVRGDDVLIPMAMKVEGEESVRLPAGEFDCWRIAIEIGDGRRMWYWVRKGDGLGVRTLDSTEVRTRGVREIVLSAERAP